MLEEDVTRLSGQGQSLERLRKLRQAKLESVQGQCSFRPGIGQKQGVEVGPHTRRLLVSSNRCAGRHQEGLEARPAKPSGSRPSLSLVLFSYSLSQSPVFALFQSNSVLLYMLCFSNCLSDCFSLLSGQSISQSLLSVGTFNFSLQISFLRSPGFIEEVVIFSSQRRAKP